MRVPPTKQLLPSATLRACESRLAVHPFAALHHKANAWAASDKQIQRHYLASTA